MKKVLIIISIIVLMLTPGCATLHSGNHKIYIILRQMEFHEDEITVYNGRHEVIDTIYPTEDVYAYYVEYNGLRYNEVCSIYSKYLNREEKLCTIKSYDDDARGTGEEVMSRRQIDEFDLKATIDYDDQTIEADWFGENDYDEYSAGVMHFEIHYPIGCTDEIRIYFSDPKEGGMTSGYIIPDESGVYKGYVVKRFSVISLRIGDEKIKMDNDLIKVQTNNPGDIRIDLDIENKSATFTRMD